MAKNEKNEISQSNRWNPWNWFKDESHNYSMPMRYVNPSNFIRPISDFYREVDRMFEDTFTELGFPSLPNSANSNMLFHPSVDIASTDKEYTITVEVPGIDEKNIKLDLSPEGVLTISGEKKQESEDRGKDYHSIERSYGSFRRTLTLPEDVDVDDISTRFKNGILTITVPRQEQSKSSQNRQIPVNSEGSESARNNPKKVA